MANNEKRQRRGRRQQWTPNLLVWLLHKVWRIGISVMKIAAGALATVFLIAVVCGFVVVTVFVRQEVNEWLFNNV